MDKKQLAIGAGVVGGIALLGLLIKQREPDPEIFASASDSTANDLLVKASGCSTCRLSDLSLDGGVPGKKITPDQIELPNDYETALASLRASIPDASDYINKIEYYFKDALADAYNGVVASGNPEDTTAYRGAQGGLNVVNAFQSAQAAGYSGTWSDFMSGCCGIGYQQLHLDEYKLVDGNPVAAPGSRVYDKATDTWYVWETFGEAARVATETERRIYEMRLNEVTDPGDDLLNEVRDKEYKMYSNDKLIEKYQSYLEQALSGGPYEEELHGSVEYLQTRIDNMLAENESLAAQRNAAEQELFTFVEGYYGTSSDPTWRENQYAGGFIPTKPGTGIVYDSSKAPAPARNVDANVVNSAAAATADALNGVAMMGVGLPADVEQRLMELAGQVMKDKAPITQFCEFLASIVPVSFHDEIVTALDAIAALVDAPANWYQRQKYERQLKDYLSKVSPEEDYGDSSYTEWVRSHERPTVKLPPSYYDDDDDDDDGRSVPSKEETESFRETIPDWF